MIPKWNQIHGLGGRQLQAFDNGGCAQAHGAHPGLSQPALQVFGSFEGPYVAAHAGAPVVHAM